MLLRVSDQAENIAQETLFAATGETKNPKVYRILFVDRANDCRSQLAEAYSRKTFPECATFSSAGWDPADSIRPEIAALPGGPWASHRRTATPKRVPDLMAEPKHFHVVIGLDEKAREMIGELPYKTVFLNWDLGPCPFSENDPDATSDLRGDVPGDRGPDERPHGGPQGSGCRLTSRLSAPGAPPGRPADIPRPAWGPAPEGPGLVSGQGHCRLRVRRRGLGHRLHPRDLRLHHEGGHGVHPAHPGREGVLRLPGLASHLSRTTRPTVRWP